MSNFAFLRESYTRGGLSEQDASPDPWQQFGRWFQEAVDSGLREPNAMTLATTGPNARIVLMKAFGPEGITFFTNYASQKGREMTSVPAVALLFHWNELERQVRLRGVASAISREDSLAYFRTRPRGSQIGAALSAQSSVIVGREVLESRLASFGEEEVPMPETWGGYCVAVGEFEFWQGRPNRLHDRLRYRPSAGGWLRERLAP